MKIDKKQGSNYNGIHAVAARAGVSVMTVSRAMRGVEGVSEVTRERILGIARELNYVPNNNARALTATSSSIIGVSVPTLYNDVFADMLVGLRSTLEKSGYTTVIGVSNYSEVDELIWIERVLQWRPSAFVLTGAHHSPLVKEKLQAAGVPTMEIWAWSENPIEMCVGIDHVMAGRILAEHAISLGYKAPCFVGTPPGLDRRADMRFRGMSDVFEQAHGVPISRVPVPEERNYRAGALGMHQIDIPSTDIVFCLNDHYAFGAIMEGAKNGTRVPQDIGVMGFNDLDLNSVLSIKLTTLRTPRRQIGLEAAKNVLARLNGVSPEASVCLPCELVIGETTRRQGT